MTEINPNDPFTRDLLRTLAATIRAEPNETDAEYARRFAAAVSAFAAFHPRDPVEQMLAAQIVAAQYAALDCLTQAMETEDQVQADKLRRSYALLNRAVTTTIRLLIERQDQPEKSRPSPAIAPIPPLRRGLPAQDATHDPLHREKAPPPRPKEDPAEVTEAGREATIDDRRAVPLKGIAKPRPPLHRQALSGWSQGLPGSVLTVPNAPSPAQSTPQ